MKEIDKKPVFVLISPKNRTVYNFRGDLIRKIIEVGYEVYVTGPNRIDVDKINDLGATFVEVPNDKNGINIVADIQYFLNLWRLFRRIKPSVTFGYTIKPVIYGALAAHFSGVEIINSMITGAGYLFVSKTRKAKILKQVAFLLYKVGLACADNVIFQNKDDRSEFISSKLLPLKKTYLVNGSGVNMNLFAPSPIPNQITFFMLSRVMYSKGVNEYLQAASILKKKYPEVRFILLGAIEQIQDSIPEKVVEEYIRNEIIDYYGESKNVQTFYAQASVFVLPSFREGTPRTVLEAMAMQRPIITTDAPGCRETVKDGESGFLVPVEDIDALVDKMEWFILHPEQIVIMGEKSFNYCKEKFDVNIVNKQMMNILFSCKQEV